MSLNKQQIRAIASEIKTKVEALRIKENKITREKLVQDFKKNKNYKLFNDYHKAFGFKITDRVIDEVIGYKPKSIYMYVEDLEKQIVLKTIGKDLKVEDLINDLVSKFK